MNTEICPLAESMLTCPRKQSNSSSCDGDRCKRVSSSVPVGSQSSRVSGQRVLSVVDTSEARPSSAAEENFSENLRLILLQREIDLIECMSRYMEARRTLAISKIKEIKEFDEMKNWVEALGH